MPDWLQTTAVTGPEAPPLVLALRIATAWVLGMAVAAIYRWARRGEPVSATFVATLVLLSTLIAMATQVIGDNVARAFSLVGALSVVRFRTVVKDTQDTAFVIFAVVVGMSSGANHLAVGLVGLGLIAVGSLALWPRRAADRWHRGGCTLSLRVGMATGLREAVDATVAASATRVALKEVRTAGKGAALNLSYDLSLRPGTAPAELVVALNALEGVDSVELSRGE